MYSKIDVVIASKLIELRIIIHRWSMAIGWVLCANTPAVQIDDIVLWLLT